MCDFIDDLAELKVISEQGIINMIADNREDLDYLEAFLEYQNRGGNLLKNDIHQMTEFLVDYVGRHHNQFNMKDFIATTEKEDKTTAKHVVWLNIDKLYDYEDMRSFTARADPKQVKHLHFKIDVFSKKTKDAIAISKKIGKIFNCVYKNINDRNKDFTFKIKIDFDYKYYGL